VNKMPRKKGTYRNYKKRKTAGTKSKTGYSKTYTSGVTTVSKVPRPLLGVKYKGTLNYYERNFAIDPVAVGVAASYVFSATGLFDPNITSTGHQPNGFDQMMGLYEHYTVISSKITVRGYNTDASLFQNFGVYANHTATVEPDPTVIIENGMGSFGMLAPSGQDKSSISLTQQVSASRFLSIPRLLSEKDASGTATTNPAEQVFWIIWGAANNDSEPSAIGLNVLIEYVTIFTEPIQLALS